MSRILIIDDEESICWGLAKLCEQLGLESRTASSVEDALQLKDEEFSAIVTDVRLPGADGLSSIESYKTTFGDIPVIVITAFGDLQTAIKAMQNGAFEYIVKPFELDDVSRTIQQAIATHQIVESQPKLETASPDSDQGGLIGNSAIMQEVYKQIALTTTTDSPVLITGESGVGKELAARSIHQFSRRSNGPFVAVNVASLSPSLVESELFGHTKGSFTGADANREGLIQKANQGTLFLDEVAEIPIEIQVKLLRVLDLGEVVPVGANEPVKTDFRLISATHQDLLSQVNHGDFRHDLFFRLRTFEIQLPPLRQRKDDIPQLVEHFLAQANATHLSLTDDFIESLKSKHWSGNVRELRNVVERATILARGNVLTSEHLVDSPQWDEVRQAPRLEGELLEQLQTLIEQWTRENWELDETGPLYDAFLKVVDLPILKTAFELSNSQYSAAARRLGIHRTTLKKKLDSDE